LVQPVTGFHVSSVHWMPLFSPIVVVCLAGAMPYPLY
jgi:hypothetical protein